LAEGWDAVLVAVGAQTGRRPPVFRGAWPNAVNGVDLCRSLNTGGTVEPGATVTVYGGGNVAFDCARGAKKAGAGTVRIMCLEPADKMLADPEELHDALEEGIEIVNSAAVVRLTEAGGSVTGLDLQQVQTFRFGPNGLELTYVADSDFHVDTDVLVLATGQQPDLGENFGVPLRPNGLAAADFDCRTEIDGVFAAGDVVTGTKTVVDAIAAARRAASAIDTHLGGNGDIEDHFFDREPRDGTLGVIADFSTMKRTPCSNAEEVTAETDRCLHCELRRDIDTVKYWTDPAYRNLKVVAQ